MSLYVHVEVSDKTFRQRTYFQQQYRQCKMTQHRSSWSSNQIRHGNKFRRDKKQYLLFPNGTNLNSFRRLQIITYIHPCQPWCKDSSRKWKAASFSVKKQMINLTNQTHQNIGSQNNKMYQYNLYNLCVDMIVTFRFLWRHNSRMSVSDYTHIQEMDLSPIFGLFQTTAAKAVILCMRLLPSVVWGGQIYAALVPAVHREI